MPSIIIPKTSPLICPNSECGHEQSEGVAEDWCLLGHRRGRWASDECEECYASFRVRLNLDDTVEVELNEEGGIRT